AGGDLLIAARGGLGDRSEQRPVLTVDGHGGLDGRSDVRRTADVGGPECLLGLVQALERLTAGAHQQVGQVVEMAVEDRAAGSGLAHHVVDREGAVGGSAYELSRGPDYPLPALLARLPDRGLVRRHGADSSREVDTV